MMEDAKYRILPAREEDIRWAAQLAARVYQGLDVIPEATMIGWFRANPNGFSTFWCGGDRVGNFDLLPLRPAAMQRFVEGTLLERDMTTEDLVPCSDPDQICDLHWESIILDPACNGSRSRMMKLFVQTYPALLERLCPLWQIGSVYAIAASAQGAGVLRRMGLSVIREAKARRDNHPLYCGTVDSYRVAVARHFKRFAREALL